MTSLLTVCVLILASFVTLPTRRVRLLLAILTAIAAFVALPVLLVVHDKSLTFSLFADLAPARHALLEAKEAISAGKTNAAVDKIDFALSKLQLGDELQNKVKSK